MNDIAKASLIPAGVLLVGWWFARSSNGMVRLTDTDGAPVFVDPRRVISVHPSGNVIQSGESRQSHVVTEIWLDGSEQGISVQEPSHMIADALGTVATLTSPESQFGTNGDVEVYINPSHVTVVEEASVQRVGFGVLTRLRLSNGREMIVLESTREAVERLGSAR